MLFQSKCAVLFLLIAVALVALTISAPIDEGNGAEHKHDELQLDGANVLLRQKRYGYGYGCSCGYGRRWGGWGGSYGYGWGGGYGYGGYWGRK
uniref:Glycine-rich protein n=1 Tax=Globodera pallida TaxID=36090 RepID=A0A183CB31_GLOPA